MADITELKPRKNPWRKADDARRAKLAVPNGPKAFHAISDMENDIRGIERAANALRLLATTDGMEKCESDAIYLVSEALERAHQGLDAKYSEAWNASWGFAYGPNAVTRQA